jgi:hypothetical protein
LKLKEQTNLKASVERNLTSVAPSSCKNTQDKTLLQKQNIHNNNVSNSSMGTPKYLKVKSKVSNVANKTYNEAFVPKMQLNKNIPIQVKGVNSNAENSRVIEEDETAIEAFTSLNMTSNLGIDSIFDVSSP